MPIAKAHERHFLTAVAEADALFCQNFQESCVFNTPMCMGMAAGCANGACIVTEKAVPLAVAVAVDE